MNNNDGKNKYLRKTKGIQVLLIVAAATLTSGCEVDEIIESISGATSSIIDELENIGNSLADGNNGGGGGNGGCDPDAFCFTF